MRFEHALRTATSAAATLAVIVASSHAMATTRTYPGAAPCDTTLQACADGAGAGDTIQIASNGVIAEFVTTDKTLTFEPAAGFTPTVEGIFAVATTVDVALTVQNLALNGVRVVLAPGGQVQTLQHRQIAGQADGEAGEDDMPADREGELHPRQDQRVDIHGGRSLARRRARRRTECRPQPTFRRTNTMDPAGSPP